MRPAQTTRQGRHMPHGAVRTVNRPRDACPESRSLGGIPRVPNVWGAWAAASDNPRGYSWTDQGGAVEFALIEAEAGADLAGTVARAPLMVPASKRAVFLSPGNFDEFWLPPAPGTFEIVPA